ncbi:hypothetical protein SLA2020_123460 [Shorea laevis]
MDYPVERQVKLEFEPDFDALQPLNLPPIDISSGRSSSSSSNSGGFSVVDYSFLEKLDSRENDGPDGEFPRKEQKIEGSGVVLPKGFLAPLPKENSPMHTVIYKGSTPVTVATPVSVRYPIARGDNRQATPVVRSCKQFWKAGDYEGDSTKDSALCSGSSVGMDHVRVHPKFLHSNATSHKWALGAFAELLDNALDEACNGATYVHIDMLENKKDAESKMLLVEDNGGGMSPDKMRACMSLGYSAKSNMANTIGQYGNGFKTSTMRLGADVIVFSKSQGNDGKSPTKSIGMLSYTFLMGTGKEDIVVPMIDYEKREQGWTKLVRSSEDDWNRNLETIVQWSPYLSDQDLLHQFDFIKYQGTRIVIYNLWEDDEGELELDFDTDKHDIQIRGVNRNPKNIEDAKKYRNSRHFFTYRHSLRSYASILYLQLPPNFRMVLRGKEVEHHNIVNDMMEAKEMIYKPTCVKENIPNDSAMVATVEIGFVKDASHHVDVQGFNVYHKNRLIKPFWRVWNAAGSNGRGVIGVLEANFVEPAHDKQGFERTTVLSRLEARLVAFQKDYWSKNCHIIGYAGSGKREKDNVLSTKGTPSSCPTQNKQGSTIADSKSKLGIRDKLFSSCQSLNTSGKSSTIYSAKEKCYTTSNQNGHGSLSWNSRKEADKNSESLHSKAYEQTLRERDEKKISRLKEENHTLRKRLKREEDSRKSLESQLKESEEKREVMDKEQTVLLEMLDEERKQRQESEEKLRARLREASTAIDELLEKLKRS